MKRITAEDPRGRSTGPVAENIASLAGLFPSAVAEGKVDFDALRELLGDAVDEGDEKFGLAWHGKRQARRAALGMSSGTLRPSRDESVGWDTTRNLLIEGDNLEALKLLQRCYAAKVKLIYIDPPYNTGKDFVYKDNYADGIKNYLKTTGQLDGNGDKVCSNTDASGRFHTNWLNMMYPRLKVARTLLRRDGLLFMTVDDMEVHHLRQIADEIFGADNFVANVVWEKKYTRSNDARFFSDNHDHILVFAKNLEETELALQRRTAEQEAAYANPDDHPKGPWKATPLHAKSGGNSSPYRFNNGVTWAPPRGTFRRFSDRTMAEMDEQGEIWFGSDGAATPSRKTFLADAKPGVSPVTIWPHREVGHNHEANNELKQLLGQGVFSNPKPTRLIQRIVELAAVGNGGQDDDIVLDFFAGSGTTGHAVLKQNALDGGRRRYILVQLQEAVSAKNREQRATAAFLTELGKPLSVSEVTKERLRRAASQIEASADDGVLDVGFRVLKLDSANIRAWEPEQGKVKDALLDYVDHIKPGRNEDDLYFELLLKLGYDLCAPAEERTIAGKRVTALQDGSLMTCLAEAIGAEDVDELVDAMAAWRDELPPAAEFEIVFRDSAFAENELVKANVTELLRQHGITEVWSV